MMKLEKDLQEYYKDEYEKHMSTSVSIARAIAIMAHLNQKRLCGVPYVSHPYGLASMFKTLTFMDYDGFDEDDVYRFNIPVSGILELCWLHDVVEDTIYTEEEIRDVFNSHGLGDFYDAFIHKPLLLITHDKSEPYPSYIDKVCSNVYSALVKLLDMNDNLTLWSLDHLGDKEVKRIADYASYAKTINDKFHFIESFNEYTKYYMEKHQ